MSFSVHTTEYSSRGRLRDAATPSFSASGAKARVCVAYYESSRCPYNNNCEHAHHFTELDRETQNKLLETVPLERIPKHFINAVDTPTTYAAAAAATRAERKMSSDIRRGRRGGGERHRSHDVSVAAPCEHSFSSMASSTGSLFLASVPGSKDGSPTKAPRREDDAFKIRLPTRCRYPHRGTAGTYYDVLGVPRDAAAADILERYRQWQRDGYKRMRQLSQQRADALDTAIVEARNVIGHPVLRAEYDRSLPAAWETAEKTAKAAAAAAAFSSTNSSRSYNTADVTLGGIGSDAAGRPRSPLAETAAAINMRFSDDGIW